MTLRLLRNCSKAGLYGYSTPCLLLLIVQFAETPRDHFGVHFHGCFRNPIWQWHEQDGRVMRKNVIGFIKNYSRKGLKNEISKEIWLAQLVWRLTPNLKIVRSYSALADFFVFGHLNSHYFSFSFPGMEITFGLFSEHKKQ